MKMRSLILLVFVFGYSGIRAQNYDIRLLRSVNSRQTPSGITAFKAISNSVYIVPCVIPVGQFAFGKYKKDDALCYRSFATGVNLGITGLLSYVVKLGTDRARPYVTYPDIKYDKPSSTPSFPSGHTSLAFCMATSMAVQGEKWYYVVPAYAWACSVAYSRMYLGKHYPSDVLGGIILGAGIPVLFHYCKPLQKGVHNVGIKLHLYH